MYVAIFLTYCVITILWLLNPYFLMIIPYRSKYLIFVYSIFLYILNCDIKIHGKPHKKNKTYLILANHYTALDYFILRWIFPCSYTVVKTDLLTQRKRTSGGVGLMYMFSSMFFKAAMTILYKRGDYDSGKETKEKILECLKHDNVIVFPEGTSHRDGIPKTFKSGIFELANEHDIDIIPCSIKYNKDIGLDPPKNGKPDKLKISDWIGVSAVVKVHDVIHSKTFKDKKELKEHAFDIIRNSL